MNNNISKKYQKNIRKSKKNTQKNIILWLSITLLVVFLFLLFLTFAYFSNNNLLSGTIKLAELDFTIYENDLQSNIVLPNGTYQKTVTVVNARNMIGDDYYNLCPVVLRFNFNVLVDGVENENFKQKINISFDENDFFTDDNFYYCMHILNPSKEVNLCDAIYFDDDIENEYQNKYINLIFNVDAVQSENGAFQEIWQDAPPEWIEYISNIN